MLFNAYTGANFKVANWPDVMVEKVEVSANDYDLRRYTTMNEVKKTQKIAIFLLWYCSSGSAVV